LSDNVFFSNLTWNPGCGRSRSSFTISMPVAKRRRAIPDAILRTRPPRRSASGGARRSRTDDILLAKQALYQLSYGPFSGCSQESCRRPSGDPRGLVGPGRLELPTLRLSGVRSNHLSYGPRAARQPGHPGSRSHASCETSRMPDRSKRECWKEKRRRRRPACFARNAIALRLLERSSHFMTLQ
jgi:hypothetical protein